MEMAIHSLLSFPSFPPILPRQTRYFLNHASVRSQAS